MAHIQSNPKHFGATPTVHSPAMATDSLESRISSQTKSMGIPGEPHDPIGHSAQQFLTQDYGAQRHMAFDSPLAQPAYSESGKVGGGKRF